MRTLNKIALVLLIVFFPLLSWYYLNTGLNYRKSVLKDLTPKGEWKYTHDYSFLLEGKTTLAFTGEQWVEYMNAIYNQYELAPGIQILEFTSDSTKVDSSRSNWVYIHDSEEKISQIFSEHAFYLIDINKNLRYAYEGEDAEMKKVVEHLSVVLPRDKDPDVITVKRNHE